MGTLKDTQGHMGTPRDTQGLELGRISICCPRSRAHQAKMKISAPNPSPDLHRGTNRDKPCADLELICLNTSGLFVFQSSSSALLISLSSLSLTPSHLSSPSLGAVFQTSHCLLGQPKHPPGAPHGAFCSLLRPFINEFPSVGTGAGPRCQFYSLISLICESEHRVPAQLPSLPPSGTIGHFRTSLSGADGLSLLQQPRPTSVISPLLFPRLWLGWAWKRKQDKQLLPAASCLH